MDVVIDSNVLFRILISKGEILNVLFNSKLRVFAPEKLKEEFMKHEDEILSKSKLSKDKFDRSIIKSLYLVSLINEAKIILNPDLLKNQAFFANAQKGDIVLIYANAKKAILYDPVGNKIVDTAPISSEPISTTTGSPASVVKPTTTPGQISATPTPFPTDATTPSPTP